MFHSDFKSIESRLRTLEKRKRVQGTKKEQGCNVYLDYNSVEKGHPEYDPEQRFLFTTIPPRQKWKYIRK